MSINSWTFSGFVGADAELRRTQAGEPVLSFRVPSTSGFGDREKTAWVDCSLWGKRGESLAQYIRKGSKVTVIGELALEEYTKRDGTPGAKLAVKVDKIDLPARSDSASAGGGGGQDYGAETSKPAAKSKPSFDQSLDDEIPF